MRFPNAFKGISKVFAAEILKLIATGLIIATGVAGVVSVSPELIEKAAEGAQISGDVAASNVNLGGIIAMGILGVGAMIL